MPENGQASYERELGSIGATLNGIQTTLSGLGGELKAHREDSGRWRQSFRDALEEHAGRTDDALDTLGERTKALETDLEAHKLEDERGRRLIWKVLLGGTGGGGTLVVAWQSAKAAVVNFFR